MTSQVELTEIYNDRRERSGSAGSARSMSSEKSAQPMDYEKMNLDQLIKAADNLDISAFDRTRLFNPRKQRSCHKRSEPVSEEHRKLESSRNSREYTKRNRDEIATCRMLLDNIYALRCRFKKVIDDFGYDNVQVNVCAAVAEFERIFPAFLNFNSEMKQKLNIPSAEVFLLDYQKNRDDAMLFEHRPSSPNAHKEKLVELREQLEKLTGDKDHLNSSKDKTNYASSKSRLNQRIVREQLKSNCWEFWNEINTMIIQGEKLQQHYIQLKKDVWNNVLGIYYHLIGLSKQRPVGPEEQQIERIKGFFAPFSQRKSELHVKLFTPDVPNDEEKPEEDEQPIFQHHQPSPPPTQVCDTKPDRLSPIPRPNNMDMTQLLPPQFKEKLMIQDRLTTTVQFPPAALVSPSCTLTLPTVPAESISMQLQSKTNNFLAMDTGRTPDTKMIDLMGAAKFAKRSFPGPAETAIEKRTKVEIVEDETASMHSTGESQKLVPPVDRLDSTAFSQINQTSQPIPAGTIPLMFPLPMQYLNPVQAAPMEMSPALIQAMEQQRIMAAFLNHAFRQK